MLHSGKEVELNGTLLEVEKTPLFTKQLTVEKFGKKLQHKTLDFQLEMVLVGLVLQFMIQILYMLY